MFTKIGLKNFKCFESVEVAPRLITVLIGANGTGKSSIIQALVLGKQSVGSAALTLNGNWLQLGEFKDVVRRGGPPSTESQYSGVVHDVQVGSLPSGVEKVEFDYGARWFVEGLQNSFCQLGVTGRLEDMPVSHLLAGKYELGQAQPGTQVKLRNNFLELKLSNGFAKMYPGSSTVADDGFRALQRYVEGVVISLEAAFRGVFFVPAGRGVDLPQYPLGHSAVSEFSNVRGSVEQAQALLTTLHYEHHLEQQVSALFEDALSVQVRTRARPGPNVSLEITPVASGQADNTVNQGYGYGPLVFVLAQLALAPSGSTICIEEPEIHLHPRAQAEVTAVIARSAKRENKQLIVATHSEHILVKFLNLVATGELSADELAVYYFEKDPQTSIARAEEMKVNADGTLEGGLRGFFEQDLAEMEEFLLAAKKKQ